MTDIVGNTAEDSIAVIVDNVTLVGPETKLTPLGPPTPISGPTKEPEEERKFLIHIPFTITELIQEPVNFIRANSNFFFGFLFALELLILFWIIKKLRKRREDVVEGKHVSSGKTIHITPNH